MKRIRKTKQSSSSGGVAAATTTINKIEEIVDNLINNIAEIDDFSVKDAAKICNMIHQLKQMKEAIDNNKPKPENLEMDLQKVDIENVTLIVHWFIRKFIPQSEQAKAVELWQVILKSSETRC